ncbi:hypothetical protein [Actinomadura geliboluensis]|uniref:hypothetical protein n=1 Tax=Actinomadura geliboluensis TaxID=882440 RepID=UPI0036B933EB
MYNNPRAVRRLLTELMDFDEVSRHLIEKITAAAACYWSAPNGSPPAPGLTGASTSRIRHVTYGDAA